MSLLFSETLTTRCRQNHNRCNKLNSAPQWVSNVWSLFHPRAGPGQYGKLQFWPCPAGLPFISTAKCYHLLRYIIILCYYHIILLHNGIYNSDRRNDKMVPQKWIRKCVHNVEILSGLRQDEAESARPLHSTEITQWDAGPVWSGSAFTGWSESCGIPASSPTLRKQPPHGWSPAPRFYGSSVFWDFFPGSASTLKFSTLQLNNKRVLLKKKPTKSPSSLT